MRRIGIMGGTFNPIHNGHLAIAKKAKEQFSLEKVLFMPSGVPYMKDRKEVLPVSVRCEMTALAIADISYFELSTLEAADAELGKNTYTFETLQKLRSTDQEAEYYFILGADSLFAIENWKNPALIFENCTLLAAVRTEKAGNKSGQTASKDNGQVETTENQKKRLTAQVQYLQKKYHAAIRMLEFSGMEISSTQIRENVRSGESLQGLLPRAVDEYIRYNHLYEKHM